MSPVTNWLVSVVIAVHDFFFPPQHECPEGHVCEDTHP